MLNSVPLVSVFLYPNPVTIHGLTGLDGLYSTIDHAV
jgi:hypothetical protein